MYRVQSTICTCTIYICVLSIIIHVHVYNMYMYNLHMCIIYNNTCTVYNLQYVHVQSTICTCTFNCKYYTLTLSLSKRSSPPSLPLTNNFKFLNT